MWAIEDCQHVRLLVQIRDREPLDSILDDRSRNRKRVDLVELARLALALAGGAHPMRRDPHDPLARRPTAPVQAASSLLADRRQDLIAERTRTVSRLRWHLLDLCPELERSIKRGALNQSRVLDRWMQQ